MRKKIGAKASSDFGVCVFLMKLSGKNNGQRDKEFCGLGEVQRLSLRASEERGRGGRN